MPIKDYDSNDLTNAQTLNKGGQSLENNSGAGPESPVLDIVSKRFCWGAFFLNWIWGLGNKTYITLLVFLVGLIPFVGALAVFGCQIWFGIMGNRWAWQNKRWKSIEHFHAVQKKWAIAGVISSVLAIILAIFVVMAISIPTINADNIESSHVKTKNKLSLTKSIVFLEEVFALNKAMELKVVPTSEAMAKYFADKTEQGTREGNIVIMKDGSVLTFSGDGACYEVGDCSVEISNSNGLFEEIPITQQGGYLKLHADSIMNDY